MLSCTRVDYIDTTMEDKSIDLNDAGAFIDRHRVVNGSTAAFASNWVKPNLHSTRRVVADKQL